MSATEVIPADWGVRASDMPDDCHDECVPAGRYALYYPYRWVNGTAHYRCEEGHTWTCGWGHSRSGHDLANAGRAQLNIATEGRKIRFFTDGQDVTDRTIEQALIDLDSAVIAGDIHPVTYAALRLVVVTQGDDVDAIGAELERRTAIESSGITVMLKLADDIHAGRWTARATRR